MDADTWKSASDFGNGNIGNSIGVVGRGVGGNSTSDDDMSYHVEPSKDDVASAMCSPRGSLLYEPSKDSQVSMWMPRAVIALWIIMAPLAIMYRNEITGFIRGIADKGSQHGKLIYFYYLGIFTVLAPFFVSVELMVVSAGFVFSHIHGQWVGVAVASTLSFTAFFITMFICFLLSRHLLKALVNRYLRHYKYYTALVRATEKEGLYLVALIRLSPFFPPTVVSYIFGTTNVRTRDYCLASFAALPSVVFFSYVGTLIEDLSNDSSPSRSTAEMVWCIVAAVGVTVAGIYYTVTVTTKHLEPNRTPQLYCDPENVDA